MDAHRALDSLLGRLTTVLVNEAQLLGRVRSDVQFIKDEMESMNGLILHLTEAQHRDHQVRAWMKQVVGLTRDCEGNVELYVHYVGSKPGDDGLLRYLRRIPRFMRTISVRHRIGTRIQELKVRARDVGDRRQRYGVTVPASAMTGIHDVDAEPAREEQDLRRRAFLLHCAEIPEDDEEVVEGGINTLVKCLSMEPATTKDGAPPPHQVRVYSILGIELADKVAEGVYQQHSFVASIFGCKAWSDGGDVGTVLAEILEQLGGVQLQPGQEDDELTNQATGTAVDDEEREKRLISKIQGHLEGKRFLIVVANRLLYQRKWKRILDGLLHAADGSLPGSAIIMITHHNHLAQSSSPYKIINAKDPFRRFYEEEARDLLGSYKGLNDDMVRLFKPNTFAMKTFLHLLYANPNRTVAEVQNYRQALSECTRLKRSISRQVLAWCYSELPSKYRSCLLYLAVFPQGHVIRTTSLARRWVAEGLITATSNTSSTAVGEIRSSTHEAEHCLDVLFIRGFVSPLEISDEGTIKSCTVHRGVREFIARVATDVNFIDSNLPPHLAHYLSIHNRTGLQKSHSDGDCEDIVACLPALAASPQWQLLKVLDLEGCKGLKKKHMKSICKILLLKYLSLRNTDVTELTKQIKDLQCLETLDIRQTKVRMLANKAIVLPQLKYFLAGHKVSGIHDSTSSEDSISAVQMPLCIHRMDKMEVVSHVQVSHSSELAGIAQLLKLRKLGVDLHGKHAKLSDLFCQIKKLHRCLRSLSIRMGRSAGSEIHDAGVVEALPSLPQFIKTLNISGSRNGLLRLIQDQHKLAKVTLSEIYLKKDDISILGALHDLRYLRLQYKSYTESELNFKKDEFHSLSSLLVEASDITKITFDDGAALKLNRIVWSFSTMEALSGVRYLRQLMRLELNGDCNLYLIEAELKKHPNHPQLKHKPQHQCQEDGNANAASSLSAPLLLQRFY